MNTEIVSSSLACSMCVQLLSLFPGIVDFLAASSWFYPISSIKDLKPIATHSQTMLKVALNPYQYINQTVKITVSKIKFYYCFKQMLDHAFVHVVYVTPMKEVNYWYNNWERSLNREKLNFTIDTVDKKLQPMLFEIHRFSFLHIKLFIHLPLLHVPDDA